MKHVFVLDPKAFYNQLWKMDNIQDSIGQFFRTQEKADFSIQLSRYRRNAMIIIQEEKEKASSSDIINVYAIGGEEIFYDCLNAAVHFNNIQVTTVPYGEFNNFLKIFGEDKIESFKDIPLLVKGDALPTDVIRWGVNYALNFCCIGMNSAISKNAKDLKQKLNKASYVLFSKFLIFINRLMVSFNKQIAAKKYKITIDDVDYTGNYSLIHAANSPYLAGRKTGVSDATPDDGLLDIVLIKASHPLGALAATRKYSRGKRPKNCTYVQGKKMTVQSDSQMWIQLDNEHIMDTGISLSIVPQAVNILAPSGLSYPIGSILAD